MAARSRDRAAGGAYRLLIWRRGEEVEVMGYGEPADALAAAVEYLKAGYQAKLGAEVVEHYAAEPVAAAAWFPSARDWRVLLGMLRRAAEAPGFFHASAESAGRVEAERLAARIAEVVRRIARLGSPHALLASFRPMRLYRRGARPLPVLSHYVGGGRGVLVPGLRDAGASRRRASGA
jgi:hypothetical protein